jgi:hypothetical protein
MRLQYIVILSLFVQSVCLLLSEVGKGEREEERGGKRAERAEAGASLLQA